MSKGSNSFIFTNTPFRPSGVGNVAAVKNTDNLATLREELLHNWQYRYGGVLNLGRLLKFGTIENSADIRYIEEMLCHENLSTTQIYTRVSITKLKEVHRKTLPIQ